MRTTTRRESGYAAYIREDLAALGLIGTDVRHVEAWMRSEHGTLDALSPAQFRAEVGIAAELAHAEPTMSEALAASYGL